MYTLYTLPETYMKGPDDWASQKLVGGFKYFLFSPLLGDIIQFVLYFSNGLKPSIRKGNDRIRNYPFSDAMLVSGRVTGMTV